MIASRFIQFLIFFIIGSNVSFAQVYKLNIDSYYNSDDSIHNTITFLTLDSISIYSKLDSILKDTRNTGYLACSIDALVKTDSSYNIKLVKGQYYNIITTKVSQDSLLFMESKEQLITLPFLNIIYDTILLQKEMQGYPLSKIHPRINYIDSSSIGMTIAIDTFYKIYFDTIELKGSTSLSYDFIAEYLDIAKDDVYNKSKLSMISQKISRLDYISLKEPPLIVFYGNRAKIVLNLKEEKNNIFDFLIGVLPQTNKEESKWLITGDITMSLFNKIGIGEHLFFHYQKYKTSSNELELSVDLPYIKKLPFGIRSHFKLLKESEKYLNNYTKVGLQYKYGYQKYFLDWIRKGSRLLFIDSTMILQNLKLPEELDFSYNGISVGIENIHLDHRTNPRKGYFYNIELGIGIKNTIINNDIINLERDSIDFINSYDTLKQNLYQYTISAKFDKYFPVLNKSVIVTGLNFNINYNNGKLLKNEKYRIGGSKILRGFDEESVLLSMYGLLKLEYRLLLSQNSYISLPFVDMVIAKENLHDTNWKSFLGFGGGLSFQTNAGLFNFSVALGKSSDVPIDFNRPKVHFGYLNIF